MNALTNPPATELGPRSRRTHRLSTIDNSCIIARTGTGALTLTDIEDAVRNQAATDTVTGIVKSVQCLTGGLPLTYPTTALCHAQISYPNVADVTFTNSYGVTITDNQGHITLQSWP